MVKYLIDNNFYSISSERYENYKNSKNNYVDWGKDPKRIFDISENDLIKYFGPNIKKTINLIYQARFGNVVFLSLTIVIVYLLSFLLSDSILIAFLSSSFYGLNTLIISAALRAQSEGMFLFLFNLSLLFLVLFFRDKNYSFKMGLLFFFSSALLTATKLNGLMVYLIFNFLVVLTLNFNYFRNKIILKTFIIGNFLFIFIFIFHHPLLIYHPTEGTISLYQFRYRTAINQAQNEFPETALWSFSDRLKAILNNFFSQSKITHFNNYYLLKNLIEKHNQFFFNFLFNFLYNWSSNIFKTEVFRLLASLLFLFFLIVFITSNYLILNWD